MVSLVAIRDVVPVTFVIYGASEASGIRSLVAAGALSGVAVAGLLLRMVFRPPCYRNTHVIPIFVSLLFANILQAIASMMDAQWLLDGAVRAGHFCSAQGGLKNGGNVAAALWSSVLSIHVFMLLFLRKGMSNLVCAALIVVGWLLVGLVVAIGPLAIQTAERGDYFGPSGYWCWITHMYPEEQTFLEYFFEFVSASCSILLYTAILLRVRGNLTVMDGKWRLRFVPRGERWLLAITRDFTDTCMMSVAARMVWHPIAYTVCLLPVTLARFMSFGGREVPFFVTVSSDFIFNLQGLVNVILVLCTRHLIPDTASLPMFAPRKAIDMSSPEAYGITPYVLSGSAGRKPDTDVVKALPGVPEDQVPQHLDAAGGYANSAPSVRLSVSTLASVDSRTPLVVTRWKWPRFTLRRPDRGKAQASSKLFG